VKPSTERTKLLDSMAADLLTATETLKPIDPLRDRVEAMDVSDAYRIQDTQLRAHVTAGRVLAGRKVGLTSLAMQKQLGVDSPDFGFFFSDMVHHEDAQIAAASFISPPQG